MSDGAPFQRQNQAWHFPRFGELSNLQNEMLLPDVVGEQSPKRPLGLSDLGACDGFSDGYHLHEGEQVPRRVADQEDQDDAHEDDGKVVLLKQIFKFLFVKILNLFRPNFRLLGEFLFIGSNLAIKSLWSLQMYCIATNVVTINQRMQTSRTFLKTCQTCFRLACCVVVAAVLESDIWRAFLFFTSL